MSDRATAENYRCLAHADWTLAPGVSLLVGSNGSGKTTLLDVPALLRDAIEKGTRVAIDEHGGPGTILNLRVSGAEMSRLTAVVGDEQWSLELRPRGTHVDASHRIVVQGKQVKGHPPLRMLTYPLSGLSMAEVVASGLTPEALGSVTLDEPGDWDSPEPKQVDAYAILGAMRRASGDYLVHGGYYVRALRMNGSRMSSDLRLDRDGTNAFAVLRNWRDARATEPRWKFVIDGLVQAFPEAFEGLGFESAGQTVAAQIYVPRIKTPISAYFAPDGVLTGLLHLTAVASVPDGGAVAIDEFENSLHPYAIRALLDHARAWAEEHQISVTLATHSPVLLDQFKDEPQRVLVMDPKADVVPVPIDKLHDPEWLAHFSLGDLYSTGEFGAQGAQPTH